MEMAEEGDMNGISEEERKHELIQNWTNEFLMMSPDVQNSIFRAVLRAVPNERKSELKEVVDNALKMDIVGDVPPEIGVKILSYLTLKDRCTAGKVSRRWQSVSEQSPLWNNWLAIMDKNDALRSAQFPPLTKDYPTLLYGKMERAPAPFIGSLYARSPSKAHYVRSSKIYLNWKVRNIQSAVVEDIHAEHQIMLMKMENNGQFLITAADDSSIILTKISTKLTSIPLKGHADQVNVVETSACGRFILTGSLDHTIKVWNSERGTCVTTFSAHSSPILAIAIDSNNTVVSSDGNFVAIWQLERGAPRILWDAMLSHMNVSKILFNGADLLTVSDKIVTAWDPLTGTKTAGIQFNDSVTTIDMKKETDSFVVGCEDGYVSIWTLSSVSEDDEPDDDFYFDAGSVVKVKIYLHPNTSSSSHLASHIIAMGGDGSIQVRRMEKVQNRWKCKSWFLFEGSAPFTDFQTTEFGYVITSGVDGTVRLWTTRRASSIRILFSMSTVPLGSQIYAIESCKTKLAIACGSASQIEPTKLVVFNFGCHIP